MAFAASPPSGGLTSMSYGHLLDSLELPIHAWQTERALEALALFHDDTFGYDPARSELLDIAACARGRVRAERARLPTLEH